MAQEENQEGNKEIAKLQANLRTLCSIAGWSGNDLAAKIGQSRATAVKIQSGRQTMTQTQYLALLAAFAVEVRCRGQWQTALALETVLRPEVSQEDARTVVQWVLDVKVKEREKSMAARRILESKTPSPDSMVIDLFRSAMEKLNVRVTPALMKYVSQMPANWENPDDPEHPARTACAAAYAAGLGASTVIQEAIIEASGTADSADKVIPKIFIVPDEVCAFGEDGADREPAEASSVNSCRGCADEMIEKITALSTSRALSAAKETSPVTEEKIRVAVERVQKEARAAAGEAARCVCANDAVLCAVARFKGPDQTLETIFDRVRETVNIPSKPYVWDETNRALKSGTTEFDSLFSIYRA